MKLLLHQDPAITHTKETDICEALLVKLDCDMNMQLISSVFSEEVGPQSTFEDCPGSSEHQGKFVPQLWCQSSEKS